MNTSSLAVSSNAALAQAMFDAFKRGDIPFILDRLTDDCQWNIMGSPLVPHAGTYEGKGTARFFEQMDREFEFTTFDVHQILDINENECIALGYLAARARATGKEARSKWVMHTRYRNGKVSYFQDYYDSVQMAMALQP